MRLGQLMRGDAPVVVLLESLQADSAEDLLGRAELREQPLKIVRAFDSAAQLVRQHRLGGSWRSDDQDVIRRQQGDDCAVDQIDTLEEHAVEFFADSREL